MRLVFVGLIGLIMGGAITMAVQAQTETPQMWVASPNATPNAIADYMAQDDTEHCDFIGRSQPRDSAAPRYSPQYTACSGPNGVEAELRCWVRPDTALFETVTINCAMIFRTINETVEVSMSDLELVTSDGRVYPPQRIGIVDESPLTSHEKYGERGWNFGFDIPKSTPMPLMIHFPIRTIDADLVFIVETLSTPNS